MNVNKLIASINCIALITVFSLAVYSFKTQTLEKNETHMASMSNPSVENGVKKGTIYDRNGKELLVSVENEDGTYSRKLSDEVYQTGNPECVSNVLDSRSGGADLWYEDILNSPSVEDASKSVGEDITLTLDLDLQSAIWDDIEGLGCTSVVVLNPNTAEIYAMVSSPSYNMDTLYSEGGFDNVNNEYDGINNRTGKDTEEGSSDYLISGTYVPSYTDEHGNKISLAYGNDNYDADYCASTGFDPNFSLNNMCLENATPGSTFKILTSAVTLQYAYEVGEQDTVKSLYSADGYGDDATYRVSIDDYNTYDVTNFISANYNYSLSEKDMEFHLMRSNNTYFAKLAIEMLDLSKYCEQYNLKHSTDYVQSDLTLRESFFKEYFEKYFNIDRSLNVDFRGNRRLTPTIRDTLGNPEVNNYQKPLAQTVYGIDKDQVSPLYMAMAMGKCLTGNMYSPILKKGTPLNTLGEPLNSSVVADMQDYLGAVYSKSKSQVVTEEQYFENDSATYSYACKTGSSFQVASDYYGKFGKANYSLVSGDNDKYQGYNTLWYVGSAYTDSESHNSYVIAVKRFATPNGVSSGDLKETFDKVLDDCFEYLED